MQNRVDLDELEASDAKRTPGEWGVRDKSCGCCVYISRPDAYGIAVRVSRKDAAHIVKVVIALPAMIAELRWLRDAGDAMAESYHFSGCDCLPCQRIDAWRDLRRG